MRIGIIICDHAKFWNGEEGLWKYFEERFKEYKSKTDFEPIYGITGTLPNKDEILQYDGFIITGSNYSANDNHTWVKDLLDFVKAVVNTPNDSPKLFGICFGHQIIGKALGGKIGRNKNGKDVFGTEVIQVHKILAEKIYFQKCFEKRSHFQLMEAHGECILDLPADSKVVGWSNSCQYEIVMWNNRVISTQGHPEFTTNVMKNRLVPFVREAKILKEEELKDLIKTFSDKDVEKTIKFVHAFLTTK